MELTEKEISDKYSNIEEKIPSVWPNYESAGIEMAQDLCFIRDAREPELYRVACLLQSRVPGLKLSQHLDSRFAFQGLYPHVMKTFNIKPE
jgi:hypothetical protein